MNPEEFLFVGCTVHYVAYGTPKGEFPALVHRAAIVTEISKSQDQNGPYVDLCVLNPTGMFFNRDLPYDKMASKGGTWHFISDDQENLDHESLGSTTER